MDRQNKNLIMKATCVLSSLVKQWAIILCVTILSGMSFDVYKTLTYKPMYSSSMQMSLLADSNSYADLEGTISYIRALDYVFNGQSVETYIKNKLNVEDIDITCTLTSVDNSNVVNMNVISDSKRNAYYSLNHIVDWYKSNMKKYNFAYTLNVLESPTIHESPMNINSHHHNFILGSLIGGIIVVGILALLAYFKDTIKVPDDIELNTDCRLFAKVPRELKPMNKKFWTKNKNAILITSLKTSFSYKESIKKLRGRLEQSSKKHDYKAIMITGSLENEGKSSIAVNLALSLVENQHKVLLIDGDIRKPSLNKILNTEFKSSLNEYLNKEKSLKQIIHVLPKHNLSVIFALSDVEHAEEMNDVQLWKKLISETKKEYDYIIVDSSPAYLINDALAINEAVDASLLVVRQHHATSLVINKTISRLVSVKNNLIGIVYNGNVIDWIKQSKVHNYRYGYGHYGREKRGS